MERIDARMTATINECLIDHRPFHSALQMDSFITARNGGTLYGCLFQSLRELDTRKSAVIQRTTQLRLMQVDIEERECDCLDDFQRRRNEIRNEEARAFEQSNRQAIADTLRECAHFYGQALACRAELEKNGIKFPLDEPTRHRLDCEMWVHNLKCKAAIEFISQGKLNVTTIELIQSLPPKECAEVSNWLFDDRRADLISWFTSYDVPLPVPIPVELVEVERLLGCSFDSPKLLPHTSRTDAPASRGSNLKSA